MEGLIVNIKRIIKGLFVDYKSEVRSHFFNDQDTIQTRRISSFSFNTSIQSNQSKQI